MRLASPALAEGLLKYYIENEDFLSAFEPERPAGFYTLEFQRSMLESEQKLAQNGKTYRFYMSRAEAPEEIIGMVALNEIVRGAFQSCFVSYKLDHRFLRLGYAREALNALSSFAFSGLRLHRLEADIMPRNIASINTALSCGFSHEGMSPKYLRINGVWEDHIHMVKLNREME